MKKFRFRLEPLLRLKAHKEKEVQKIHAAAVQKVLSQERTLTRINDNRLANQDRLRGHLSGSLNLSYLSCFSRYFLKLKKDELVGREMLKIFQKDTETKRLRLLEATKQRKIYEKLKERHQKKYRSNYELIMQKELDEVASQMECHKKSSRV